MRRSILLASMVLSACEREAPPGATKLSAKELDARAPEPGVCVSAAARRDDEDLRADLTDTGDVVVCVGERCSVFEVATGRRRYVDKVELKKPGVESPWSPPFLQVVTDGVEVTLPGWKSRTIPVAGARAPHEKSGYRGTPAEIDRDGELLVVVVDNDAIVYDVKTTKFVRRFKSTPQACFFGKAFYAQGFRDPRSGALIAHLGGAPGIEIACLPRRNAWWYGIGPSPHRQLSGETWAFLSNDGTKMVLEDVSTHASPTIIELQAKQKFPRLPTILESRKRLAAVLTGPQLGDIVLIDPATKTTERYPVPTCASDAGSLGTLP